MQGHQRSNPMIQRMIQPMNRSKQRQTRSMLQKRLIWTMFSQYSRATATNATGPRNKRGICASICVKWSSANASFRR